jgi:hypothetical protein
MSEENIEVVRLAYDYVSTGQDAATALAIYDPEVEWDISQALAACGIEPHVFSNPALQAARRAGESRSLADWIAEPSPSRQTIPARVRAAGL